ncbi:hypothetical protein [Azospirillum endophyticum]
MVRFLLSATMMPSSPDENGQGTSHQKAAALDALMSADHRAMVRT